MSTSNLPRPEPVTRAGAIAGAVAGLIITVGGLARALGWLTDDLDVNAVAMQVSNLILGAGALWVTLAPSVLALWARGQVTPLADPRDADGSPLAVEGEVVSVVDDPVYEFDEPGQHAAPEDPSTELMPAVRPPVPAVASAPLEPTPIGDSLADTMPAAAVRG